MYLVLGVAIKIMCDSNSPSFFHSSSDMRFPDHVVSQNSANINFDYESIPQNRSINFGDHDIDEEIQQSAREIYAEPGRQTHWNKQASATGLALYNIISKPILDPLLATKSTSNQQRIYKDIIRKVWSFFSFDPKTNKRKQRFYRKDSKILLEQLWVDLKQQQSQKESNEPTHLQLQQYEDSSILEADNFFLQTIKEVIMSSSQYRYSFMKGRRMIDKLHAAAYFDCYFVKAVEFKEKRIELRRKSYQILGVIDGNDHRRQRERENKIHYHFKKKEIQDKIKQIKMNEPSYGLAETFKIRRKYSRRRQQ